MGKIDQYLKRSKKMTFSDTATLEFFVPPSKRTQCVSCSWSLNDRAWMLYIDGVEVPVSSIAQPKPTKRIEGDK